MEYHVEHHMYAGVPCYKLRKLNRAITHDIPAAKGLIESWREIAAVRRRQKDDPQYSHVPELPEGAAPFVYE